MLRFGSAEIGSERVDNRIVFSDCPTAVGKRVFSFADYDWKTSTPYSDSLWRGLLRRESLGGGSMVGWCRGERERVFFLDKIRVITRVGRKKGRSGRKCFRGKIGESKQRLFWSFAASRRGRERRGWGSVA